MTRRGTATPRQIDQPQGDNRPVERRAPPLPNPKRIRTEWIQTVQRLAGNRAVAAELSQWPRSRLTLQREEPGVHDDQAVPQPTPTASPDGPGRPPTKPELNDWAGVIPDGKPWRILRPAEDGYNCFAWAVGSTSYLLTNIMVEPSGNSPTLDSWTTFLTTKHGFGRSADRLDPSADLILYGDSATQILHAARRADEPYEGLTFSSKIGGGVAKTPVILHAPADIQSNLYGHALRSFWRAAGPAEPETPTLTP